MLAQEETDVRGPWINLDWKYEGFYLRDAVAFKTESQVKIFPAFKMEFQVLESYAVIVCAEGN